MLGIWGGGGGYESMLLRHWKAQIIPNVFTATNRKYNPQNGGQDGGRGADAVKLTNCKIKTIEIDTIE